MMKRTQNDALTWASSGNALVDQYFQLIDDTKCGRMTELLNASWREDKRGTLVLLYDLRNCRGGKGRHEIFSRAISKLVSNFGLELPKKGEVVVPKFSFDDKFGNGDVLPQDFSFQNFQFPSVAPGLKIDESVLKSFEHIPHYGSFKDLWRIGYFFLDREGGKMVTDRLVEIFCDAINKDCIESFGMTTFYYNREANSGIRKEKIKEFPNISMASKYAPKKKNAYSSFFIDVRRKLGMTEKAYRWMCSDLRSNLNVVETLMSTNRWEEIDFSKVHSLALKRYIKSFKRHSEEKYNLFLQKVNLGEVKANVGQIYPHEFVRSIMRGEEVLSNSIFLDEYIKQKNHKFRNVVTICDTSGSMHSISGSVSPIQVAIALTILAAWSNEGSFSKKFIEFSESSNIVEIKGENWEERIKNISNNSWGFNTDVQKAFDTLLEFEDEVECVIVISDMQFDSCGGGTTNFETIDRKYTEKGKKRPLFVFWNVSSKCEDCPVKCTENGVVLVSGYSTSIFDMIIDCGGKITPEIFVNSILSNPMYERINIE